MNKKGVHKSVKSKGLSLQQTEVRIAPIPDPKDLEHYEKIQSGFAERLVFMAEKEQEKRHQNAKLFLEIEAEKVKVTDFKRRLKR